MINNNRGKKNFASRKPSKPNAGSSFGRPYERKFDRKPRRDDDNVGANNVRPHERKFEKKPFNGERKFGDRPPRRDGERKFDRKPFDKKFDKPFEKNQEINIPENSGMIYGRNAVIELLKSGKTIDKIFVQNGQREGSVKLIVAQAVKASVPVIEADKNKLDGMINGTAHQGVIALASDKEYCSIEEIISYAKEKGEQPFILVADKIMDPQNLGAIIRSAECAGVHGIIIPKRSAASITPAVTKASAGAVVHMNIAKVANITNALEQLKELGVWIFATTVQETEDVGDDASVVPNENNNENNNVKNYYECDYKLPLAFVLGSEGEGLPEMIIKHSDFLVTIPMYGKIESLNVSCAASVLLYEAAKQRNV